MSNHLKTLISKLNHSTRSALERAANLCIARGHYEVDLEHVFLALLEADKNDFLLLCAHFEVSRTELQRDLESEVSRFKSGSLCTPVFSSHLPALLEHAWLIASLVSQTSAIRSSHLLLSFLTAPGLSQLAYRGSRLFMKFKLDELKHHLAELTHSSPEATHATPDAQAASGGNEVPALPGKTPALDQFTTNLTQRAADGKIDPVIGRDAEIRQCLDILMRRRQNNPILTGEAGVGKTAVVEGLALRMAQGDVPQALQGVQVHTLDMGLLQAGASVKGEFENRLKNVIDEVKRSAHPIILFIDEAHTMIGAGGQAGQNDAANLLKPALARGELRTVAATTWSEYKKYFEKDAALARRFQVVKVEEPSEELAAAMLRGMAPLMEEHFKVRLMDEAVTAAVRLSARYISGRQLPDKAISVLDTACAKVALGQSAPPAALDELRRKLDRLQAERDALSREAAAGAGHHERLDELSEQQDEFTQTITSLTLRWNQEKALAREIFFQRAALEAEGGALAAASSGNSKGKAKAVALSAPQIALKGQLEALKALQQESPLVPMQVDAAVVAEIVSAWTGIPLGKMVKDELQTVLQLQPLLQERIIGQDHALHAVAQRVRTASANLEDPNKPRGVFMFVGPSGVGKTETALALAELLYGGERHVITINMSEYQEAHSVSGLKGSPPGYLGFGEGGVLTEAVRRRPHSVVLLDEVEKAHPDVLEMFFHVFDRGVMDDAEGREIDFRHALIILTSNIGSQAVMQSCLKKSPEELPDADTLAEQLRPQLYKAFKPAFLGRMKVVPYYPLSDNVLVKIIRLKLDRITQRVAAHHRAQFDYDDALVEQVLARCTQVDTGARAVDHILNGSLLPEIAESVLARMAEGKAVSRIKVSVGKGGKFEYAIK